MCVRLNSCVRETTPISSCQLLVCVRFSLSCVVYVTYSCVYATNFCVRVASGAWMAIGKASRGVADTTRTEEGACGSEDSTSPAHTLNITIKKISN